jgi:hypothetical protein
MTQLTLMDAGIFKEKDLINKTNWEIHGKTIAEELRKESAVSDKNEGRRCGSWVTSSFRANTFQNVVKRD